MSDTRNAKLSWIDVFCGDASSAVQPVSKSFLKGRAEMTLQLSIHMPGARELVPKEITQPPIAETLRDIHGCVYSLFVY